MVGNGGVFVEKCLDDANSVFLNKFLENMAPGEWGVYVTECGVLVDQAGDAGTLSTLSGLVMTELRFAYRSRGSNLRASLMARPHPGPQTPEGNRSRLITMISISRFPERWVLILLAVRQCSDAVLGFKPATPR